MNAADILKAALGHMEDRAATYDKPEGERSMPATVAAFNALTGHTLTAEQGWLFMTVLKLCRTQQGGFRADNYEDGSAYFALMGEQAAGDRGHATGGYIKTGATYRVGEPAPLYPTWATHYLESHGSTWFVRACGEGWEALDGAGLEVVAIFNDSNMIAGSLTPLRHLTSEKSLWVEHKGRGSKLLIGKGSSVRALHRDNTESAITELDPSGTYWNWAGKPARPTDIIAYRSE